MRYKIRDLLLAVVLGLIVPTIICSVFARNVERVESATESTSIGFVQKPVETTKPKKDMQNQTEMIPVLLDDGRISDMLLDDYLISVILCEMPTSFEIEALKAQAVVARTYVLRQNLVRHKHNNAAVCTKSSCCQGYRKVDSFLEGGGNIQDLQKVRQAVAETQNFVLMYDGVLIDATYFSCSGGKTEDAVSVWGSDIPYLQSVDSPEEEIAAVFVDTVVLSKEKFSEQLQLDVADVNGGSIGEITYTDGGGVDTVVICGRSYKGTELRSLLGLRSTAFVISIVDDTVSVTTKGYGHRVGMSQYGAEAMARRGNNYDAILLHYYQGANLVNWVPR